MRQVECGRNPRRLAGHDDDAMAQPQSLQRIVRHQQDGAAGEKLGGEVLQIVAGDGIELRERLVHQHHGRVLDENTGQRHALAHAAGERAGQFVQHPAKSDAGEQLDGARTLRLEVRVAAQARARAAHCPAPKARAAACPAAPEARSRPGLVLHSMLAGGVIGSSPASSRSSEDLPTPLGPSRQVQRPPGRSKSSPPNRGAPSKRSSADRRKPVGDEGTSDAELTRPSAGANRFRFEGSFPVWNLSAARRLPPVKWPDHGPDRRWQALRIAAAIDSAKSPATKTCEGV